MIDLFVRPVININSVIPALMASSTAYWIKGLSTIGSISFGFAFVAGKKRVPIPATGKTALVTFFIFFLSYRNYIVINIIKKWY